MNRRLTITLTDDWKSGLKNFAEAAKAGLASGNYQGETLNFESPAIFFGNLTQKRWELVRLLQSQGALGVRELARLAGRDVRRVHDDLQVLLQLGLLEKSKTGKIECPYDDIYVDMHLRVA